MKPSERSVPHVHLSQGRDSKEFRMEVYDIISQIPKGKVLSYADVAALAGAPDKAAVVSYYLTIIPPGMEIPYHRVVSANGHFPPKFPQQRALLEAEGIILKPSGMVDMDRYRWDVEDIDVDIEAEFFGRKER